MKTVGVVVFLVVVQLVFAFTVSAKTIMIQKPEMVFQSSPLIVEAIVQNIRYSPISNLSTGEARITLSVVDRIVGSCPDKILIRRHAVTPSLNFLEAEWFPAYSVGERFIICLRPNVRA